MSRRLNATAALRWCFLALLAHSLEGCEVMVPAAACGGPPCEPGSSRAIGFPDLCRADNQWWLICMQGYRERYAAEKAATPKCEIKFQGQSSEEKPKYLMSAANVGADLFVQALYASDRRPEEEKCWASPVASDGTSSELCRLLGYKSISGFTEFGDVNSAISAEGSPSCNRPASVPGHPFALWCVKCSNE